VQASYRATPAQWPWIIHLAEGVDGQAAAEFEQLAQLGLLQPNTVLVHGVGLASEQRQALIDRGGGLIWCPGSNHFLFGRTACVAELAQVGKVALGSDSRLSGEFDLLAELRVAAATNQVPPAALLGLVTELPARLLRLQGGQGELRVNGVADLVLLPPAGGADPFEHFLNLERSHLELVLLAGRPLVASPWLEAVFKATRTLSGRVQVDGVEKLMPRQLAIRLAGAAAREPGFEVVR
jgi:cytosine/adenosine deaminase-related metal-dependent hydrolase